MDQVFDISNPWALIGEETKYVCLSRVKSEYKLREPDIADMKCKTRPNPHHINGAPMRLYLRSEIKKRSEARKKQLDWEAEHADEIKAKKEAEKAAKKAAKIEHARQHISGWKRPVQTLVDSGTPLPVDLWIRVLEALCADLEPEGVRGVSVVARDLLNVGLTCKELHGCALQAFNHLSSLCPAIRLEEEWNAFLRDPSSQKLPQLKALAPTVGTQKSLQKAPLTMQLLKSVGMDRPSLVPIRVVWAVGREKRDGPPTQLAQLRHSVPPLRLLYSVFSVRATCMSLGLCTTELLREEAERTKEAERIRQQNEEKQRQKWLQEHKKRQQERLRQINCEQEARAQARIAEAEARKAEAQARTAEAQAQAQASADLPANQQTHAMQTQMPNCMQPDITTALYVIPALPQPPLPPPSRAAAEVDQREGDALAGSLE